MNAITEAVSDLRTDMAARGRVLPKRSDLAPGGAASARLGRAVANEPTTEPGAPVEAFPTQRVVLPMGPVLNQRRTGHCAGFAAAALYLAAVDPDCPTSLGDRFGHWCYEWVRTKGPTLWLTYPGIGVGAVMPVHLGYATEYGSAASVQELAHVVTSGTPVLVGVAWYDSMDRPRQGNLTVTPNGDSAHFVAIRGFDPARDMSIKPSGSVTLRRVPSKKKRAKSKKARRRFLKIRAINRARLRERRRAIENYKPDIGPAFLMRNSWGKGWGSGGDAWISAADLHRILVTSDNGVPSITGSNDYAHGWAPDAPGPAEVMAANP